MPRLEKFFLNLSQNNTKGETVTETQLETLRKLFDTKIETDDDYKILGEIFGEDE
jgi:hypothetical protein